MRELTKLICCIYPTSKLFVYILEGLKSKNNRTRIESVDHIGYLIERIGVEVSSGKSFWITFVYSLARS